MPAGLITGLLYAIFLILAGIGVSAKLIDMEIIRLESSGYLIMAILLLSSWLASKISTEKIQRQKLVTAMLSGAILWGFLMLIPLLFFNARYSGVGESALLILCGSGLGIFSRSEKNQRNRKRYTC